MQPLEIISPEYSPEGHFSYHLYLELSDKLQSAVIVSPESLQILKLVQRESDVESFISSLGDSGFKSCLVSLVNESSMLIPVTEFDASSIQAELTMVNDRDISAESIRWDSLNDPQANLAYTADPNLVARLEQQFNNISIGHSATFLIFLWNIESSGAKGNAMFCNSSAEGIEIACFKDSELQYFNQFPNYGKNDLLYHLLNCSEVLDLKRDKLRLNLSGDLSQEQIIEIKKYFSVVNFLNPDSRLSYPEVLTSELKNKLYTLLQLHLCE